MNILVTGGAGYIGSHTCISLIKSGHNVIVIDNLSNGNIKNIDIISSIANKEIIFYENDITNEDLVFKIFKKHFIDGVIHFAGLKAVGESVEKPLIYYYNNVLSTLILLKACDKYNVNKFIFSSSATVYGDNTVPFMESQPLLPSTNPYGESKKISEKI